ncbi:hypothetical protein ETD86_08840 [Nonomuraea turkmeniaca]|uniref:Uncharacterized protein n=1 Tax=Nonomuraea turkmeniaca TaxID=103838 RepID=A0A5S4FR83_9ACTN|nr:hypothetical protein ETD86_08840 [Nonomuraea turkmeniaca]
MKTTVPLAVGVTTMVIVGMGKGAPDVMAVAGAAVPVATTCAEATGAPLGLTVPAAVTMLLGLIEAVASKGLAAGWMISHVRVAVELGLGREAGVFTSMEKVTVVVGIAPPAGAAPVQA